MVHIMDVLVKGRGQVVVAVPPGVGCIENNQAHEHITGHLFNIQQNDIYNTVNTKTYVLIVFCLKTTSRTEGTRAGKSSEPSQVNRQGGHWLYGHGPRTANWKIRPGRT